MPIELRLRFFVWASLNKSGFFHYENTLINCETCECGRQVQENVPNSLQLQAYSWMEVPAYNKENAILNGNYKEKRFAMYNWQDLNGALHLALTRSKNEEHRLNSSGQQPQQPSASTYKTDRASKMVRVTLGDIARKTAIKMLVATFLISLLASAHCGALGVKEGNLEKAAPSLPEEKKAEGNLLPKSDPAEIPEKLPEELPARLPEPLPEQLLPGRIAPESLPLPQEPQAGFPLPLGEVPLSSGDLPLSRGNVPLPQDDLALPEGAPKGDVAPPVPADGVIPDGDKTDLDTEATLWGLYGGWGYRRPYRRWSGYGWGGHGWGGRAYGGWGGYGSGYTGYNGWGRGYGGWGRGYGGYGGYWR